MSKIIKLKQLILKNFKGIKDLTINFSNVTSVSGENGTGKTSVFDAFNYLLFNKDSQDRVVGDKESNFQIKTYDKDGNIIHGLEHSVTGILEVDGKEMKLDKVYKEKWTKKKGEAERQLTGNDIIYSLDDVPMLKSDYEKTVSSLVDENLFKLLTNPLYFSINLKWQERRRILLEIIGDITADRVINYNSSLRALEPLLEEKDIDTLKKSISARIKKLNDEIKSLPYRIDECNNSITDNLDYVALEKEKLSIKEQLENMDRQILDVSSKNDKLLETKDKIFTLKSKLQKIEHEAKANAVKPLIEIENKAADIERKIERAEMSIDNINFYLKSNKTSSERLQDRINELHEEFNSTKQEELYIDTDQFVCPTCHREFEAEDIESKKQEMTENFNENNAKKLRKINEEGKRLKFQLDDLNLKNENYLKDLDTKNAEISTLKTELQKISKEKETLESNSAESIDFTTNAEYMAISKEIEELKEIVEKADDTKEYIRSIKLEQEPLNLRIDEINTLLATKDNNIKLKARIKELEEQETMLGQEIAKLEGIEFKCDEFIKTKVELLEGSINSKFKNVRFKMFETQINGGLVECCEALIDGVPFSNANTAAQYNAGLDIINALSEYYQVKAPIFIDNRESVNQLIYTETQLINLIVSKDKTLKIESEE